MDRAAVIALCHSFPGVTEDVKWETNQVFSVGGKMFAVMNTEDPTGLGFKTDPELFYALTEMDGVNPSPYLARYKWVSLERLDTLKDDMIQNLVTDSYRMVFDKLPKKVRKQITDSQE